MRLGRIFGFPISLDPTMLIVVGVLAVYNLRGGGEAFLHGLLFLGILFLSVLWHELGHAVAVRRLGLGESEIVLHGLGGVTRYTTTPNPRQGILVALAGPGAGLLLAAVLYPLEFALVRGSTLGWAVELAVTVNVLLNLLNLIPMMPLDGGQVLRFGLLWRLSPQRALRITAVVGFVVLTAVATTVWFLDLGGLFVWLILALVAAENWRLISAARTPETV